MSGRFEVGAAVRVREAWPPGHVRTPFYTRGKHGVVLAAPGAFPNPEALAYGRDGLPPVPLYRVLFRQQHLWPGYQGGAADTTVVDIYEHWLECAAEPS